MACRMFDEEYVEWENATTKCQELGARLPVLSDADTIKIVKKYLETAEFEVFEVRKLKKSMIVELQSQAQEVCGWNVKGRTVSGGLIY
jgi:hypothetical protein